MTPVVPLYHDTPNYPKCKNPQCRKTFKDWHGLPGVGCKGSQHWEDQEDEIIG